MRATDGTPLEIAAEWRSLLTANGWTTLEALLSLPNDKSFAKPGLPRWRERLRCALRDAAGTETIVFVKRFHAPPLGEQVRRWLTGDPNHGTAWTEWTWLHRLAQAGILAPQPLAYGEQLLGIWERKSALMMAAVPGASLERWCDEHRTRLPRPLRDAVAETVARLHALGVVHRDLYLAHIFCDDPHAAAPRVWLIDLQRALGMGWRRRRWIVKDLAALNYSTPEWAATPRDRLRWFQAYLKRRRLTREDRIMARWILVKTERIKRHDLRAGRGVRASERMTPGTESVAPPGLGGYDA